MPEPNQTAEVKFKWVFDNTGVKAVNEMTGATQALNTQEAEYQKKLEAAKKQLLERKQILRDIEAFSKSADSAYGPAAVDPVAAARAAAQQRADLSAKMRAGGYSSSGMTVQEEAAERLNALRRAAQVKSQMAAMSGGKEPGLGSQLGGVVAGHLGIGGMMAGAGGAAAATLALFHGGASLARGSNEADSHAFQTEGMRGMRGVLGGGMPLVGGASLDIVKYFLGTGQAAAKREQQQFFHQHLMEQRGAVESTMSALGVNTGNYNVSTRSGFETQAIDGSYAKSFTQQAAADAARRHDAVHLPSAQRDTVEQRVKFEEGQAMIASRRKAAAFAAERDRLSEVEIQQLSTRNKLNKRILDYDKEIAQKKEEIKDVLPGGKNFGKTDVHELKTMDDIRKLNELRSVEQTRFSENEQGILRTRQEDLQARAGYLSATKGPEYWQAQLSYREGREAESAGQARSLGMAGPAARFQSDAALDMLKLHGMEFAPPELSGMAAAHHPREVAAMAERTGAGLQGGYGGEGLPGLAESRAATDEARKNLEESSRAAGAMIAGAMLEILKGSVDLIAQSAVKALQSKEEAARMQSTIKASPLNTP